MCARLACMPTFLITSLRSCLDVHACAYLHLLTHETHFLFCFVLANNVKLIHYLYAAEEFLVLNDNPRAWGTLFNDFFVQQSCGDDLLFLVPNDFSLPSPRKKRGGSSASASSSGREGRSYSQKKKKAGEDVLEVYRKGSTTRPLPHVGSTEYNWEHSVCLNTLLQVFRYNFTIAVCTN